MNDSSKPLAAAQSKSSIPDALPVAESEPATSANVARASKSIAIIGGGLAGMAAAAVLSGRGLRVELFEQSNRLGGRAGSFEESWNGQEIDQCQHVAMGCCTNFLDFCRRSGVENCFQRHKTLHFIGPDGMQSDISAAAWLPAPYHLLPGLMRLKFLTRRERWSILRTLRKLIRLKPSKENYQLTVGRWLQQQGQSETAIERFWSVVLVSALSETVDFASLAAARKVFVEAFYTSRHAYELIATRVPLGEVFARRIPDWLEQENVHIHRSARVMAIARHESSDLNVHLYDGSVQNFDAVIVAVPWFEVDALLFSSFRTPQWQELMKNIQPAAITAIHLWFDRPITDLPHAALVGRLSQWIFNGNLMGNTIDHAHDKRGHGARRVSMLPDKKNKSYYYQVVVSAAHRAVKYNKEELLKIVLSDLQSVFSETRQAELLHSRVVEMPRAVFSMQPWMHYHRVDQKTSIPNLLFAGDWTETGWPGTMEGAVRSGYLAAEGLLKYLGR
jgi:squalene-associated FAD-dependent desaturase